MNKYRLLPAYEGGIVFTRFGTSLGKLVIWFFYALVVSQPACCSLWIMDTISVCSYSIVLNCVHRCAL